MQKSISLESSILNRLPPEILIHIVRFLPVASAASFVLCCHSTRDILGRRYWEALQTEDQQRAREAFLSLLEKICQIVFFAIIVRSSIQAIKPVTRTTQNHPLGRVIGKE